MEWEAVIGLEIHAQLATASKIFSASSTAYGAEPNTQASAVDLGLPGVLPVLNEKAVEMAVLFGVAVGAKISNLSIFARKNYFYPDLPKGYQISQYEEPIVTGGCIEIQLQNGELKVINLTRAHLEEDAGKSIHEGFDSSTGIDLNRAGTPLLEIVSEPQMHSAAEAVAYMRAMRRLLRYLEICDGNMQEGSFRCDANVSVRKSNDSTLGTRTEIKNLNSFRFVEHAIQFEIDRQIEIIESGGDIKQETMLYDADQQETRAMRGKEDAHDYRYFPDPDLLPIKISDEYIRTTAAALPELPVQKRKRFVEEFQLASRDADVLCEDPAVANYFEAAAVESMGNARLCANWVTGALFAAINAANLDIEASPIAPKALGILVSRIADDTISGKIAKQIFEAMWKTGLHPDELIVEKGLQQVTDDSIIAGLVDQVLRDNPDQIEQYRAGKSKIFGFLVGQVMKLSNGKASPKQVNDILKKCLNSEVN
ncbi:MAG TPA: Asp-tRNA(Asn)/Glu-tRNA(Gln) amidotransferase GatCAB subunit B [Gammaproteobacteria bacterium]|nr:Asp-tRNA(Asn)/Glu-tRNA(Gln) amidotransferase GatCAB subunit B [Gammaproteobacteria bacterium]|tara:strand:+ start:707 stop:2152 length:1446 start_codon:yes stop_codon:yes gene_type:complete